MPTTHTLKVEGEKSSGSSQGRTERPSGAAAFALDTSGIVDGPINTPDGQRYDGIGWGFLDSFTKGYIEALFSSLQKFCGLPALYAPPKDAGGITITELTSVGFSDLAPETLAAILKDCADLHEFHTPSPLPNTEHGGRSFWTQRNEGWGRQQYWRKQFSAAFPPLTLTLGDDGKVRASLAKQEG